MYKGNSHLPLAVSRCHGVDEADWGCGKISRKKSDGRRRQRPGMWPGRVTPKQCPVGDTTLSLLGGRCSRPLNWNGIGPYG